MRVVFLVALLILGLSAECMAADILYLGPAVKSQTIPQPLQDAASFYGVRIVPLFVESEDFKQSVGRALEMPSTVGMIIDAYTMKALKQSAFREALALKSGKTKPVLVLNVTEDTAQYLDWFPEMKGSLDACKPVDSSDNQFSFSQLRKLNHQLAGLDLTLGGSFTCAFQVNPDAALLPIISIRHADTLLPVFLTTGDGSRKVFISAEWKLPENREGMSHLLTTKFTGTMIPLMFLRYASGNYAWHSVSSYANLTIDDPWLVEPYGFLDYGKLLKEMKTHRFHTTVAFIPWNYDRSHKAAVSLFATNADTYSISIHGNNHDHREFGILHI